MAQARLGWMAGGCCRERATAAMDPNHAGETTEGEMMARRLATSLFCASIQDGLLRPQHELSDGAWAAATSFFAVALPLRRP